MDRGRGKSALNKSVHDQPLHDHGVPASNWRLDAPDGAPSADFIRAHEDVTPEVFDLAEQSLHASAGGDSYLADSSASDNYLADSSLAEPGWSETSSGDADSSDIMLDDHDEKSVFHRVADWRVKLRFHRADVYLGTAVVVAALALLWPTVGSPQPTLTAWQRALVTLGLAEVPPPAMHVQGDPAVEVWIDPHTALYYCPGEEQYGKAPDGHFTSQREAQMDRFEPAGRSACE